MVFRLCLTLFLGLLPALSGAASNSVVREVYYASVKGWDDYLAFADDFESALTKDAVLSQRRIWSLFLHSAIVSQNASFEGVAQQQLLALGVTRDELRGLYRIDPRVLTDADRVLMVFAQRAGVLPVKINANDIKAIRQHFDDREIANIVALTCYAAAINVLYGTGFVDNPELHPERTLTDVAPQLFALNQTKQEHPGRFERRQFLESPILAPALSIPWLGMDWVIFNPHRFTVRETWEWFTVGMRSSDCKHCQAHGALGQHFEGNSRERIQRVFTYRQHPDTFTEREYAAFSFIEAGLRLPTTITPEMIETLRSHYADDEISYLLGVMGVIAQLSNIMQVTAVVTDQESADFAQQVIGPLGWHIGRHAGWPEEQRPMHPTTLHRVAWEESAMQKNLTFYSNAFFPVMLSYYGDLVLGSFLLLIFELGLGYVFLSRAGRA